MEQLPNPDLSPMVGTSENTRNTYSLYYFWKMPESIHRYSPHTATSDRGPQDTFMGERIYWFNYLTENAAKIQGTVGGRLLDEH